MTHEKRVGAAPNGPDSTNTHSYFDRTAAARRRWDAAHRLPPNQCSSCSTWVRDPLLHNCYPGRRRQVEKPPECGCYRPEVNGHRNETCNLLGELTPPRHLRGVR